MSWTPPFRGRRNLTLNLSPMPRSPVGTYLNSPLGTPLGATAYSPFRSASLQAPHPYDQPSGFISRHSLCRHAKHSLHRLGRVLTSTALWFFITLTALIWWWGHGGRYGLDAVRQRSGGFRAEKFAIEAFSDLQFFPASNPKIQYVGRWTAAPNRLRMDGTFPGVYFDITINSTSSLVLSLHNSDSSGTSGEKDAVMEPDPNSSPGGRRGHLSFHHFSVPQESARPVSLLSQVDEEEYVLMPNATGMVTVRKDSLNPNMIHNIRIIAPMVDDHNAVIEFEGLWLDKGGRLLRVEGTQLEPEIEHEDALVAENESVGKKHRLGLYKLLGGGRILRGKTDKKAAINDDKDIGERISGERKKMLEIITDTPGLLSYRSKGSAKGKHHDLLSGVMGWEYLLGEMFGIDHVNTGVDGMCLMQDCIGGTGSPAGMGDTFFRSGPAGTSYFERPWAFQSYVPDVMILNIGASDSESIEKHQAEYNKTTWDLVERYEDTYVSFVKSIRELAYPRHPELASAAYSDFSDSGTVGGQGSVSIPIFIMRPLRGQFEHATQGAVNRLRADGDKSVFWLDTSGWLNTEAGNSEDPDFYQDGTESSSRWHLTERGNQRVAIYLHMHACRYLAKEQDKCAFLEPEVYQGKVFDPDATKLDRYIEIEKGRRLKEMFWGDDDILGVPTGQVEDQS
ncbi:MAG: hypothetical protein M1825_002382 [Sarcosagium campestre]|nr:MAG: hypothetical protein M1825_002382 [Sarcosagium campestre]